MQVWKETDSHISPGGEKKFELEFCFFSSILYCKEIIGVFFFSMKIPVDINFFPNLC